MSNCISVVVKMVGSGLNDIFVPVSIGVADDRQRSLRHAAPVLLEVHVALAPDLHLEPLAHGVDGATRPRRAAPR